MSGIDSKDQSSYITALAMTVDIELVAKDTNDLLIDYVCENRTFFLKIRTNLFKRSNFFFLSTNLQ